MPESVTDDNSRFAVGKERYVIPSRWPYNQDRTDQLIPERGALCSGPSNPEIESHKGHTSRFLLGHGKALRKCAFWTEFPRQKEVEIHRTENWYSYLKSLSPVGRRQELGISIAEPPRWLRHWKEMPNHKYDTQVQFEWDPDQDFLPLFDSYAEDDSVERGYWYRGPGNIDETACRKLQLFFRCHRVLIFREISHDGTQYDPLRMPRGYNYVLRRKPNRVETDSDQRFRPWGWGIPGQSELTFPRYFAAGANGVDLETGGLVAESYCSPDTFPGENGEERVSPGDDVMDNLSPLRLLNAFKMMGLRSGVAETRYEPGVYDYSLGATSFLEMVPAGEKHDLILEIEVIYAYKLQVKVGLKPPRPKRPFPWYEAIRYEPVARTFHSLNGRGTIFM